MKMKTENRLRQRKKEIGEREKKPPMKGEKGRDGKGSADGQINMAVLELSWLKDQFGTLLGLAAVNALNSASWPSAGPRPRY